MILTHEEQLTVNALQEQTARFNEALLACFNAGLEVKLESHSERMTGRDTPLLIVTTRCRSALFPAPLPKPKPLPSPHRAAPD